MTYSLDFRRKVLTIQKKEDLTFIEVARRFGVGVATVVRWHRRIEPIMKRNKPPTKLDMEALCQDIELYPDAYQYERAERLGVSPHGIWHALRRLGVTYKKNSVSSESLSRKTICLLPRDKRV